MGILNMTPDSFSDGNLYNQVEKGLAHVATMIAEGADIIDIGGESTRPGAAIISTDEELSRVIPMIEAIKARFDIFVSIDTSKATVMQQAVASGADMINDVKALSAQDALETAAKLSVPICLMHMQGTPQSMQDKPNYANIIDEVLDFFRLRLKVCYDKGIDKKRLIIDPGFGFGKTVSHNLQLLANLDKFKQFDLPILVGLSRKSLLQEISGKKVSQRLSGSLALALIAMQNGANIIRVHDVDETQDILKVYSALDNRKKHE